MDRLGIRTRQTGELQLRLLHFGRRLRLRDGWLLAQGSLWLACMVTVLIQLAGRVWPVDFLWLWTLAPIVAWLLIVVGASLLQLLPSMDVARRVDAELGLKERLATALALQVPDQPIGLRIYQPTLVTLQRQDALSVARTIDPRHAFPLCWLRRPLLLAALLALMTVTLALWPNPMDAVLADRAAVAEAAHEQAEQIEKLGQEIEDAQELTAETREELLRQLAELIEQLSANPGDREEALADLSGVEEALRQQLDPNADARQAALEALAAQLETLAEGESGQKTELSEAAEALAELAEKLAEMDVAERESLAQALAQMAARTAQSGDIALAQALAALAQAAQSGDGEAASQAAQAASAALAQAQGELVDQAALRQALAQLQESRGAIAQAGQGQGKAAAQTGGQGSGQGQGQPGGGGGTQADTLPPARRSGRAGRPQGEGEPGAVGELDGQVYVPWERRQESGQELTISGSDTGQGETQVREAKDPLPGAPSQALVPYHEVYYTYLDAANQVMERSHIPPGLKDYVREYFSQLEP